MILESLRNTSVPLQASSPKILPVREAPRMSVLTHSLMCLVGHVTQAREELGSHDNCDTHFPWRCRDKEHAPMPMRGLWPSVALKWLVTEAVRAFSGLGLSF